MTRNVVVVVVVVVLLPRSVLLEQARGTEIANRSPRSDPEITHLQWCALV